MKHCGTAALRGSDPISNLISGATSSLNASDHSALHPTVEIPNLLFKPMHTNGVVQKSLLPLRISKFVAYGIEIT